SLVVIAPVAAVLTAKLEVAGRFGTTSRGGHDPVEVHPLAGSAIDAPSSVPRPDTQVQRAGNREWPVRLLGPSQYLVLSSRKGVGPQHSFKVAAEDNVFELPASQPVVVPPAAVQVPPPRAALSLDHEDGALELRRREAAESLLGAVEVLACRV